MGHCGVDHITLPTPPQLPGTVLRQRRCAVQQAAQRYDSELYNDLLQGWKRERISTRAQTAEPREEVLWMNFDYLKQESLWDAEEED